MSHPQSSTTPQIVCDIASTQRSSSGKTLTVIYRIKASGLSKETLSGIANAQYRVCYTQLKRGDDDASYTATIRYSIEGLNNEEITKLPGNARSRLRDDIKRGLSFTFAPPRPRAKHGSGGRLRYRNRKLTGAKVAG